MQQILKFACDTSTPDYQGRISKVYELNGALHVLVKIADSDAYKKTSKAEVEVSAVVSTTQNNLLPVHYYVVSNQHSNLKYNSKKYSIVSLSKKYSVEFTKLSSAAEFRSKMIDGHPLKLPEKPFIPLESLLSDKPAADVTVPPELLLGMGIDADIAARILLQNPDCIPILIAMNKAGIFTKETSVRNNHQFAKVVLRNLELPEIIRAKLATLYQMLAGSHSTPCVLSRDIHQTIYLDILRDKAGEISNLIEIINSMPSFTQQIADRLFSCTDEIYQAYDAMKQTKSAGECMHYLLSRVSDPLQLYLFYNNLPWVLSRQSNHNQQPICLDIKTFKFIVDHIDELEIVARDLMAIESCNHHQFLDAYLNNEVQVGVFHHLRKLGLVSLEQLNLAVLNPYFNDAISFVKSAGLVEVDIIKRLGMEFLLSAELAHGVTVLKQAYDIQRELGRPDIKQTFKSELLMLVKSAKQMPDKPARCCGSVIHYFYAKPLNLCESVERVKKKYGVGEQIEVGRKLKIA